MVLGVYMWAKKGSRESSFKVLDNRGSHDWKLQSSCGKITDRCHVGFRCRLSFSVVLSLKCWHPQCTPVTLQLVLLHRHKPHQKRARLHWWVGRRDNIQRGTFSSQKPKKSLKLWFMLPHVVFSCRCFKVNLERCNGNFNKNPWLQIHSTYILKHSWVALGGSTISYPAPPLLCGG